jgi:ethanolamine ammonia-lyase small subunit
LDERSRYLLQELPRAETPVDLSIIVSDGLSALAVHRQSPPVLKALLKRLRVDNWRLAPIVVARFGRVALQDEVGKVLGSQLALMLIGERPGLGSPDSLGAYLVYGPQPGNTDANRNCVSNIRAEGLPHDAAAETIYYLLTEARRRKLSGVDLKDQRALA